MARPPKSNVTNKFMDSLREKLLEKYSAGTANLYLTKLRILNKDVPFTSLAFLKDHAQMIELMAGIDNANTRKSYLTAVVGVLDCLNVAAYNKINNHYKKALNDFKVDVYNKIDPNEKTTTQKDNWVDWKEVVAKQALLQEQADKVTQKEIDQNNLHAIQALERNVLLNLYTQLPPRRNNDYYLMRLGSGDEDSNWYDGKKFTFNVFKTARARGKEVIDVPPALEKILNNYIKMMDLAQDDYLLFSHDDKRKSPATMTRALNSIFGKKIGASMLRHIWTSHLLGNMMPIIKENAAAMGHSVGTDLNYVKV
jgi:integrase